MPSLHEFWEPNDWELHVYGLLQDRHGALNIVKVPARHKGDLGIDYYCLSEQVAYQCYAAQEPCEVAVRADKQKAKITTDLKKFCTKNHELQALFGGVQIKRWVLAVPIHDSVQVNTHLSSKTAEIKGHGLAYVAPDFEATIHDLDSFDPASRTRRASQRAVVTVPGQPPTQQEIDDWAQTNPLVRNLQGKLRKRVGADDALTIEDAVRNAIGWFLERENMLDNLRQTAPELHEALVGVITRHAARLSLYGPPSDGSPHHILRMEVEDLMAEIREAVPNFATQSAQQMALGTIADWLLRCPLDFPPYSHAS